jgi:hypothetical protein
MGMSREAARVQVLLGHAAIEMVLPALAAALNQEGGAERDGCSDNGPEEEEP